VGIPNVCVGIGDNSRALQRSLQWMARSNNLRKFCFSDSSSHMKVSIVLQRQDTSLRYRRISEFGIEQSWHVGDFMFDPVIH